MPAYMIARVDVTDPERLGDYLAHTPRILDRFGGRFIVRGAPVTTVEGPQETNRIVVIEFPTVEAAHEFYDCDEYGLAKAIRLEASTGQFIIVDGYGDDAWVEALAASNELSLG